jgi:N-acetylglucosamine kinase-like BadF-type ATPase
MAAAACAGLATDFTRAYAAYAVGDMHRIAASPGLGDHGGVMPPARNDLDTPVLVGIDAGATKAVAIAVTPDGERIVRVEGSGANPKRHGLDTAADRIAMLATDAVRGRSPALLFVAGAGIDRPEHARALEVALARRLPDARIIVVNDTLAALRAGTPDAVGLAVPVSTGGNVIGRGPDGRVTDRGHGIFGGAYVLGALAARAARRGRVGGELRRAVDAADLGWTGRRPFPEAALLGGAVARAAEQGDAAPARMVSRWCARVTAAVGEEVDRLGLGPEPAVVVYGGLLDSSPWLGERIRRAILAAAPGARLVTLDGEPAEGAAQLALDAWCGTPIAWEFTPRR